MDLIIQDKVIVGIVDQDLDQIHPRGVEPGAQQVRPQSVTLGLQLDVPIQEAETALSAPISS